MNEKKKPSRTSSDALAQEAAEWDSGKRTPKGWHDAPDAVPGVGRSQAISLRMPTELLEILKVFARREGIGYQVLLKRWLDERVQFERDQLRARRHAQTGRAQSLHAPAFPLTDSADLDGPHYVQ